MLVVVASMLIFPISFHPLKFFVLDDDDVEHMKRLKMKTNK